MAEVSKYIMENLPIPFLNVMWEGQPMRYPIEADAEVGLTYKDVVEFDKEELETFNSLKGYCK